MATLYPESLEKSLPWIRHVSQGFAHRWPSIDPVELEEKAIEWWLQESKPPNIRDLARNLRKAAARRFENEKQGTPIKPLPEVPEDTSQLSLDAFVLECQAARWSESEVAAALGVRPRSVRARLARLSRDKSLKRGKRNWRGERVNFL